MKLFAKESGEVRGATLWLLVSVAFCFLVFVSLFVGTKTYSFTELVNDGSVQAIVLRLRLPRVLFAALIGGGLAVIGASYQALFRNPLASPFSLGVSSGAALGASIALVWGAHPVFQGLGVEISAVVGALLSILGIVILSHRERSAERLLLVGVVFSFLCSSVLTLIQYLADYSQLFKVSRWLMGGVPSVSMGDVGVGALLLGVVVGWLFSNHREFDLFLFGEDLARTKGVDTHKIQLISFVMTSLFVGWVVAQCGVIGFVGIIVPAVARLVVGISHKQLLPMSLLLGASLVVACDLLGRVLVAPFEIPAGVFTAVVGGPAFIALLLTRRVG